MPEGHIVWSPWPRLTCGDCGTQFELSESGGGTEMKWEADVRLMGQVGSMGQRVLQPIVNQQVKNVLAALDKQVSEAKHPAPDAPLSAPASTAAEDVST